MRNGGKSGIIAEKDGVKMRDFPFFTTETGISSLVLREIPYRKEAYIHLLDVQPEQLSAHLRECVSFCRMAGAERIFAAGEGLDSFPKGAAIVRMRGSAQPDREQVACLFPVTKETAPRWREIHNKAMAGVDNAATLESRDEERLMGQPGAYFVHDSGSLLGIGWIADEKLLAMAAVRKGSGHRVMHSLLSLVEGGNLELEVASTNQRAIALYERFGFVKVGLVRQWYDLSDFR